ncbi:hypothetical protein WMY93_028311 [Mugilogobius chulae]|uniref:mRNA decay activator protein ZFP36 n=1 Tax=Mugilogobius chulae TaxID=88201 RepID=A0AAW0MYB5_9GOBI
MTSDFLSPFVELQDDFCSIRAPGPCVAPKLRPAGLQRRHSHCPVTLPSSRMNGEEPEPWGPGLVQQQMDRSVSMIEGPPLPPPPGLTRRSPASELAPELLCEGPSSPLLSPRYKTELCRSFQESGACMYGAKCQFAHGPQELRGLRRHPKYKTEPCRTFHTIGFCPYGARCHFIHNADELRSGARRPGAPQLRHSIRSPDSLYTSPLLPEPGALKHFSCPLSTLVGSQDDLALHFSAVTEQGPGALWRCSSQDSVSDCVSEEGYGSCGSRSQSPCGPQRRPLFSRMSPGEKTPGEAGPADMAPENQD